jgi:hypothetical protein
LTDKSVEQLRERPGDEADKRERDEQERQLPEAVVPERDRARGDAERDAEQPRREEAAGRIRDGEPGSEERQRVRGVTADGEAVVMRELADGREREDRGRSAAEQRPQKNLRAPR